MEGNTGNTTVICGDNLQGECDRSTGCTYSHVVPEKCRNFTRGKPCSKEGACPYLHGEPKVAYHEENTTKEVTEGSGEGAGLTEAEIAEGPPDRLKRAETVLSNRTSRIVLVLEQCMDSHNHQAVLRTAEALGILYCWVVEPNHQQMKHKPVQHKLSKRVSKSSASWLQIRTFKSIRACIDALKEDGREIWSTDLSEHAERMGQSPPAGLVFPEKLAVVIGRESDGVSKEMLAASSRRLYLPMYGFTESFNLSVGCALLVQRLFDWCPAARGDLSPEEKAAIREQWLPQLAKNATSRRKMEYWAKRIDQVGGVGDLRRSDHTAWVPPSIRRREAAMSEFLERGGGAAAAATTSADVASGDNTGAGAGAGGAGAGGGERSSVEHEAKRPRVAGPQ